MDGLKHDSEKVDMTILPPSFLIETATALTYGSRKYDRYNFLRLEGAGQRYAAAMMRHWVAWMSGEDIDPDSGLSHLSCASANLAMLIASDSHGIDIGSWRISSAQGPRVNRVEGGEPPGSADGRGARLFR